MTTSTASFGKDMVGALIPRSVVLANLEHPLGRLWGKDF